MKFYIDIFQLSIVILLAKLSVKILISFLILNNSINIFLIQSVFFIHFSVAMYSASAVDVATTDCFFDCQQIGSFSIRIIYPEVDFLLTGSLAKSESVYAKIFPFPLYSILKF